MVATEGGKSEEILVSLSRFLSNMNSTQIRNLNVEFNVPSTILR